jgi:hypothetical protein
MSVHFRTHSYPACGFAAACYDGGKETMATAASIRMKANGQRSFNAQNFLDSAGVARKVVEFRRKETIFSQGDPGRHVIYIQKGGVRLSVVNETGKQAVVAVLGPGDFFGEGCLAGQPLRIGTATAGFLTDKRIAIRWDGGANLTDRTVSLLHSLQSRGVPIDIDSGEKSAAA